MNAISEFPADATLQALASLDRFRFRAVVDWIGIQIHLPRTSNFHTVQARLGDVVGRERRHWVKPLDKRAGGAATHFQIHLHDPESFASVQQILERLALKLPYDRRPTVGVIEVSVDAYSKTQSHAELEAMVLRMKHTLDAHGSKELECGPYTDPVETVWRVRADRTLVVGAHQVEWRVYLKDFDNKEPIADQAQHRARVEVNLSGDRRPVVTLEDLAAFPFESLSPFFSFRRLVLDPSFTAQPITAADVARQRRLHLAMRRGQRELPSPTKRERRKHPRQTVADRDMKRRVRYALRDLTRRWSARK